MNIKQLEYFISVAEHLSFTKAAENFYISQTAVTQQIKALEDQLNVILLTRSKRQVQLTPAGKVFLDEAKSIIKNVNDAIYKTQQIANGFFATLNIGIMTGYERNNLPQYLKQFTKTYPNVSIDIQKDGITELLSLIKNNCMDLAFVINPKERPLKEFEYKTIEKCSLLALLPLDHPLSNKKHIELTELKYENFIFVKETGDKYGQRSMVQNRYRESGFVPNIVQRCNDINTILLMVASNIGVSVIPSFFTSNSVMESNICVVPISEDEEQIEVVAVWNRNNTNPALYKFLSLI